MTTGTSTNFDPKSYHPIYVQINNGNQAPSESAAPDATHADWNGKQVINITRVKIAPVVNHSDFYMHLPQIIEKVVESSLTLAAGILSVALGFVGIKTENPRLIEAGLAKISEIFHNKVHVS